jgi:hypothetical protein
MGKAAFQAAAVTGVHPSNDVRFAPEADIPTKSVFDPEADKSNPSSKLL